MNTIAPSSLDSAALARRLGELVGHERNIQADFLLHLDEFDRRRAYLDASFGSLWEYCLRALHLREGAAGRRIGAMRVLRRFPGLEPALRDGRLCLSTASLLGQVLTDENLTELVERAAYRTKAEVEELVVSVKPRPVPVEGVRRLSFPAAATNGAECPALSLTSTPTPTPTAIATPTLTATEVRPVAEERWSVRVTLDAAAKADLDELKALLSHKVPDGDVGAVVREALRFALEKLRVRRGAAAPAHVRRGSGKSADPRQIPAAVRREVWKRDGGRCTFVSPDGRRCESRWKLEFDHVTPVALGGKAASADDLRLRCRAHNVLEAEWAFGREQMDRFRRGRVTIAGDGGPDARRRVSVATDGSI